MTPPISLIELADIELAERCEKLTGPCRETDARIDCYLHGWTFVAYEKQFSGHVYHWRKGGVGSLEAMVNVQPFTASLDAAMTLEVERWWLTLDRFLMSDDPARYSVMQKTWRVWLKRYVGDLEGDAPCYQQKLLATGPTQAIALTAGWLRARAASEAIPHG